MSFDFDRENEKWKSRLKSVFSAPYDLFNTESKHDHFSSHLGNNVKKDVFKSHKNFEAG